MNATVKQAKLFQGHSNGIGRHWKLKIIGDRNYRVFMTKKEALLYVERMNIEVVE